MGTKKPFKKDYSINQAKNRNVKLLENPLDDNKMFKLETLDMIRNWPVFTDGLIPLFDLVDKLTDIKRGKPVKMTKSSMKYMPYWMPKNEILITALLENEIVKKYFFIGTKGVGVRLTYNFKINIARHSLEDYYLIYANSKKKSDETKRLEDAANLPIVNELGRKRDWSLIHKTRKEKKARLEREAKEKEDREREGDSK